MVHALTLHQREGKTNIEVIIRQLDIYNISNRITIYNNILII